MAERLVTFERDGAVGIVTLRRPEKFNALDIPMLRALEAALDEAELAEGVRVVLICGDGKGFCAGGDVEAWGAMSAADFQRFLFAWQHVDPQHALTGPDGLRAVIAQLDGLELPARAWERDVLPGRVSMASPAATSWTSPSSM